MNEVEIWKDIPEYEGLYQVSNLGNVKSLFRNKERILKPGIINGYYQVNLRKINSNKWYRIHRLVASVFIPNHDNKPHVDHINGIRNDNRSENLRWCTQKENNSFPLILSKKYKPVLQINKDTGDIINEFPSIKEAANVLNINHSDIITCCKGRIKTSHGYIWKYK